jgi:hypothetical protein
MGFLTVNHNEVAEKKYEVLPEGDYEIVISAVEKRQSTSGNDMLKLTLTVRNDIQQEGQKRKVWDYLVDTEKAKFKFQQVAKSLGIANAKTFNTIDEFANEILYKSARIRIKHERSEYNNKVYTNERVASYFTASNPYEVSEQASDDSAPF